MTPADRASDRARRMLALTPLSDDDVRRLDGMHDWPPEEPRPFNARAILAITLATWAVIGLLAGAAMATEATAGAGAQAVAIIGGGGSGGGTQTIRTTPDAIAPGIYPSAPCIVAYSGGASVTGFGLSVGGGATDIVCQASNLAAIAHQIGRQDVADVAIEVALAELMEAVTPRKLAFEQEFPK